MTGVRQGCFAIPVPLFSDHRLDYEDVHSTERKCTPVDTVDASKKLEICRRSGGVVSLPPADAGEDRTGSNLFTNRPQYT